MVAAVVKTNCNFGFGYEFVAGMRSAKPVHTTRVQDKREQIWS